MNAYKKFIYLSLTVLTLTFSTNASYAAETEFCEPFKKLADDSMVKNMLRAAKFDQLFRIKQDSSTMGFCVQSSAGLVKGEFSNFKGGVALSGANSQTMVSINVDSLDTNMLLIGKLLKSDTFLDTKNHPKLTFISSGFHWLDTNNAVLKGKLTMRGITKEVAFYVSIIEDENDLGDSSSILVKATTTVLRSEFGMDAMSPLISDKINLCMSVEAERYSES